MPFDPSEKAARTDYANAGSPLVSALSVYVEPLVDGARVAVIGDGELGLHTRLLELGARTVHLFDPDPQRVARIADDVPRGVSARMLRDDFDVRDGAFDLVVIPDIGVLPDPSAAVVRLRRVVDPRGAVVAMGRARTAHDDDTIFPELTPAVVEYAELYDLFALQFENVTMNGVLPFQGIVFAELGAGDDIAVSVDTRLAEPEPPVVFVVVAGRDSDVVGDRLDPYAIVQTDRDRPTQLDAADSDDLGDSLDTRDTIAITFAPVVATAIRDESRIHEAASAFAAMQIKAELLAAQLDEHRSRLSGTDGVRAEYEARLEQVVLERDVALTRAAELEGILGAAQLALGALERRLVHAEQGMLERDDQIATLNGELDARMSRDEAGVSDELTLQNGDAESLATDTQALEDQLRERAQVIAAMEKELARREQMVRELVGALEEAREASASGAPGASELSFEAAPSLPGVAPEEVARLRRKLDELAFEVARREGELVAQTWQIAELENEKARLASRRPAVAVADAADRAAAAAPASPSSTARVTELERDLARARDELDALRQALTQEHAARVAAESGEELSRARAELAHQAALLEQIRARTSQAEG